MKKKVVALMMSAVMAFSLAACGDGNAETSGSANPNGGALLRNPVRVHRKAHLRRKALRLSRRFRPKPR